MPLLPITNSTTEDGDPRPSATLPDGRPVPGVDNYGNIQFDNTQRPPNFMRVFVPGRQAYSNMFAAKFYSRIQLASDPGEETLNQLLFGSPGLDRTFVTYSRNMVIVFDKFQDAHSRHYAAVRQLLDEHGLAVDERKTIPTLEQPLQGGFGIEKFGRNAVAVFDAT